jgi:hypothetical protein
LRGAQRGNSNTLRWALVAGIAIVAVVATIVAIKGFGKNTSPPKSGKGTAGCLHPATVHARTKVLPAPLISIHFNRPTAKKRLKTIEKLYARHRSLVVVAPNGRHFVASRSGRLVLGTTGKKGARAITVPARDIAFTRNSQDLIYEVSPAASKYACAKTALMTMGLRGKNRRLLLATNYSLLNASSAASMGTLMQDELPSGWIVLVDSTGKLYGFDLNHHVVGPLQTGTLGALYTGTGVNRVPVIQVSVSPNGKYIAESSQSTSGFSINSLPGDVTVRSVARGTFPVSWSHSGYRIAFITHKRNALLTSDVISTLDLRTGKSYTVKPKNKKLGALTLSNVSWSPDDLLVGFTGAKSACAGALSCRVRAFIGTWKGKRVHQVAASPVHKKQKNKKKTPVLR